MNLETISRQDYTLTKEIAYLFGVYLSDGSITEKNFQLQAIDKDFVENTLKYWKKIIPKSKAYLRKRTDKKSWNKSDRYVIKLGIGDYAEWFRSQTNNKHHLPLCLLESTDTGLKKWLLAGIMDGDGYITKHSRKNGSFQYRIGLGGVEEGWVYEARMLFQELGVKCNKVERFTTKTGKWFCRFTVNPGDFFKSKLFFNIKRKKDRCIIASTTTR